MTYLFKLPVMWTVPSPGAADQLTFQQDSESLGYHQAQNQSQGFSAMLREARSKSVCHRHRGGALAAWQLLCYTRPACKVSVIGVHQNSVVSLPLSFTHSLLSVCLCSLYSLPTFVLQTRRLQIKQAPNRSLFFCEQQ